MGATEEGPSTAKEMVSTCQTCFSEAETQMERPQPPQSDTYKQKDFQGIEGASHTLIYRELQSLEVPVVPESGGRCHGCKCTQLDEHLEQVAV